MYRPTSVITTHYTTAMDHNTENVVIEFVKRPRGRPRKFTAEEQKEKVRIISQRYYQNNVRKKRRC